MFLINCVKFQNKCNLKNFWSKQNKNDSRLSAPKYIHVLFVVGETVWFRSNIKNTYFPEKITESSTPPNCTCFMTTLNRNLFCLLLVPSAIVRFTRPVLEENGLAGENFSFAFTWFAVPNCTVVCLLSAISLL